VEYYNNKLLFYSGLVEKDVGHTVSDELFFMDREALLRLRCYSTPFP
jgi:hypothetical protein